MSQIRLLYRLQELDNDIRAKKQRLGDVLRLQNENDALKTARDSAAAAVAERDKWQKQRRKLETEIADQNHRHQLQDTTRIHKPYRHTITIWWYRSVKRHNRQIFPLSKRATPRRVTHWR